VDTQRTGVISGAASQPCSMNVV